MSGYLSHLMVTSFDPFYSPDSTAGRPLFSFHAGFQRKTVFPGNQRYQVNLSFGHFIWVNSADAASISVYMPHQACRLFLDLLKLPSEFQQQSFGRVIIIVQQHLVHWRFGGFFLNDFMDLFLKIRVLMLIFVSSLCLISENLMAIWQKSRGHTPSEST